MNMKLLNLTLLLLPLAACTPVDDADDIVAQAPFTLSVDKTVIESDGQNVATFKIVDANGVVLTDNSSLMSKIYFKNEATGKRLARKTKTFRSVEDGEYTFSATVSGETCENTVTVKSENRSNYEVFKKNVCIYRFTATWCGNCPSMTQGLDRVNDWTKDRIVELGLHGAGSTFAISDGTNYIADYLYPRFDAGGFPSCVYDLNYMSDTRAYSEIEEIVFDRIALNPTTCGIKANSSYSNGVLTLNAWLKTSTGGKYDIGYALLEDDCDGGAGAYEEEYDNVVRAISGNYEFMSTAAMDLQKNEEHKFVELSQNVTLSSEAAVGKYSIAFFALKRVGTKDVIDNVVKMPIDGGNVDYIYN